MLPNWYGIPGIGFEWRGSQSDPMLHYKGHVTGKKSLAATILGIDSIILGAVWGFVFLGMLMGW